MPVIEAHVLEGYDAEAKRRLSSGLTNAVRVVMPAKDEAITVLIHELPAENYARGGQARSPAPALPDPAGVVRAYLAAMEARDLDAAQTFLHPEFEMVFPGTAPMRGLGELIEWAKGRYRFVTKTYDAVEAFHDGDSTVVYVRGALSGEWPDGRPFDGIRYIDRFALTGGLITRQDVWNDIAEVRPNG